MRTGPLVTLLTAGLLSTACGVARDGAPIVAAASDLRFALDSLTRLFEQQTGERVNTNLGSSGNLATQIIQGAPFELFMSADERYVRQLQNAGLADGEGVIYGVGRLVVLTHPGSPIPADRVLDTLRVAPHLVRNIALANWEHAPYGEAAREVLQALNVFDTVRPRIVVGENVSQAAQFVLSGAADAGLVALSLVAVPLAENTADYALIPDSLHSPLRQRMVLLKGAGATARAFYEFVRGEQGRAVLAHFGFTTPEPPPRTALQ